MNEYSDEAKRIADEMTLHAVAKSEGWVCFRLSDGSPLDHNVYERRIDAVKAAGWDRDRFIYLEVQPDGMPVKEADACSPVRPDAARLGIPHPVPRVRVRPDHAADAA